MNNNIFDQFGHESHNPFRGNPFRNFRSPRMGHGDVSPAVLRALGEKPMHGYEIIQHFEQKSHGLWRPSPGSIYPILQSLEDQELVKCQEQSGKKVYELTQKGRDELEKAPKNQRPSQFEDMAKRGRRLSIWKDSLRDCLSGLHRIGHDGSQADTEKAGEIIDRAAHELSKLVKEIKDRG